MKEDMERPPLEVLERRLAAVEAAIEALGSRQDEFGEALQTKELLAFQDQIGELHGQMKKLETNLLRLERHLATLDVECQLFFASLNLERLARRGVIGEEVCDRKKTLIYGSEQKAKGEIQNSPNPLETAMHFRQECSSMFPK